MPRVRLHLDADASSKALHQTLVAHGHDVTRTPTAWIARDATDEQQLLAATAQGRCLFTFNIRDFMALAHTHQQHRGILVAAQQSWSLSELIQAIERFLSEMSEADMEGQVHWLNRWRS